MIEGKATINFGTGDILITPITKADSNSGYIVLQNHEAHVIGEYSQEFKEEAEDVVVSFKNTESLDVLIERLNTLKKMMLDDKRNSRANDLGFNEREYMEEKEKKAKDKIIDNLVDFIMKRWECCPIPEESYPCEHWFGENGCKECFLNYIKIKANV